MSTMFVLSYDNRRILYLDFTNNINNVDKSTKWWKDK